MEISGEIRSTTCPFFGWATYVNKDGTKREPYFGDIEFAFICSRETNIDNNGNISPYTDKFLDLEKEWIEEFMANPEKEQLLFHFDWYGEMEDSWSISTFKAEKTMKATLDLGNDRNN